MTEFNKLVRDKIPEIMSAKGETPITKILNDAEYGLYLEKKLDEEVAEYHCSKELEELADILEAVYALCESKGFSVDDLLSVYREKHNQRGGFSKKILLIGKE
ncbi:MAG: nucleoside triphosphate pyrophosphohydrolase [Clostridia bacterium]|nr:nucleoside triphosphate pyrophosphohydrolase [Clostridia bacterium]